MGRIYKFSIITTLALSPMFASANVCEAFESTITEQIKRVALELLRSEAYPTDSGPARLRQQSATNYMAIAQVNVNLMQQNGCKALSAPLDPSVYFLDALACASASRLSGTLNMSECKISDWKVKSRN